MAKHISPTIIDFGLSVYSSISELLGMNVHTYTYNGTQFQFEYTDPKSFKLFRSLIKDGIVVAEGIPVDIFDRNGCDAVIDVGAHYGLYSVILGKLNPTSRLYVYEPAAEPRYRLKRNLALNNLISRAKVSDNVIGGATGNTVLFDEDPRSGSEQHQVTDELGPDTVTKRSVTLSDLFDAEDIESAFIKIDVEGKEDEVIEDLASQTIVNSLSGLVEFHPDKLKSSSQEEILDQLMDANFSIEFVCNSAPNYEYDRPIYYFER